MRKTLFVAMASAGLLAACGGGSGTDATTPVTPVTPTPPSTSATVALSGTAAKGLMANADVGVYAVNADGSVAATPLQTTTTDAQGKYSLSFTGTKDQPYVVRVSANANTTHADEVTGTAQPLPVGFQMRSLVVPAATGAVTTSASITPFSEMAVAAAAKATGGVTAGNAAQAISTVTQLLGFNPTTVAATTTATAASGDEQKLAVMLTAVSQMASSGDLGCSTGSAGDKTKCVVEALGAAASTTSIKLSSGSGSTATDVSAVLSGAVSTVLANPSLAGTVSSSSLATVVANLACTTSCTAATTGTTPSVDKAATAIAAAKLLFAEMKSDWSAMFSRHGTTSIASGAANLQASAFEGAMSDVHLPVKTLLTDSGAMLMGIDLYNDYKTGRTAVPSRSRAAGEVAHDTTADFSGIGAAGCGLYQDAATQTLATTPDNANFIGCSARYYLSRTYSATSFTTTHWRHGFTLTPNADGSFGWQTRARQTVYAANGAQVSNLALQTDATGAAIEPFTGTVTPTVTNGQVTAFTMTGDWAGGFDNGSPTLANHHHAVALNGTRSIDATSARLDTATVTGSLVAKDSAGATLSTLTVKSASLASAAVSRDANGMLVSPSAATAVSSAGSDLTGGALNLVFSTATAEFEGVLEISGSVWDKSGTLLKPTAAKLSGALRNSAGGVTTEFLKGVFTASSTGYASFDATQAYSATNRYSMDMRFVGSLTAPGRPVLEISFGGTQLMDSNDGSTQGVTLQYRTLVAGQPRLVVSVTGSRDATTGEVNRFKLTEASAGLSLNWVDGASAVELVQGDSLVIGSVNMSSGVVTFSDNSFVSLDVGL